LIKSDTKKIFLKKGTCSQTFFYLLNREFGHLKEAEERAVDPLAGGIMQLGYQCGMLWGSTLAVGAEAYRRNKDQGQAIAVAINATRFIVKSFIERMGSADCYDITATDFSNKISFAKFMLTGKFLSCFKHADRWAPEAIQSAREGVAYEISNPPRQAISCASEVLKKMGATEEEIVMVAGFAGGMGLSGNACGALGAVIWWKTLALCKATPGKSFYSNPEAKRTWEAFQKATDYEFLCNKIIGREFKTIDEHTDFIRGGGCAKVIEVLVRSY
jgi:hypothetical protein